MVIMKMDTVIKAPILATTAFLMTLGGIGYGFAQQSGYNLTVNVTGHAFGNAAV